MINNSPSFCLSMIWPYRLRYFILIIILLLLFSYSFHFFNVSFPLHHYFFIIPYLTTHINTGAHTSYTSVINQSPKKKAKNLWKEKNVENMKIGRKSNTHSTFSYFFFYVEIFLHISHCVFTSFFFRFQNVITYLFMLRH